MNTEPVTFELPVTKQSVKLKPYATGRVMQAIQAALFGDSTIKTKVKPGDVNKAKEAQAQQEQEIELQMSNINASRNAALEAMVISIGDKTDNILDYILDELPEDDYNALVAKVDDLTGKSSLSDKKK